MPWTIEFFEDDHGRQPAREWLLSIESAKRAAAIAAIETYLVQLGQDVCGTEHGKHLGAGMFEFRVRHDERTIRSKAGEDAGNSGKGADVLLRIFCHAHGQRIVLLLGGYDKGASPSSKKQAREIEKARGRLRSFQLRLRRQRAGARRRG